MKTLLTALFILASTTCFAQIEITGATGVVNEHSALAEVNLSTTGDFQVSASYGVFGDTQYIDGGLSYTYKRLTLGCAAAYLYTVPEKLTGHLQFKPFIGIRLTEQISIKAIHFSNGSDFLAHERLPNRGVNFIGLSVRI